MEESVDVRAGRGADLLDDWIPGWYNRVNLDALDISDCDNCVLGQLYGNFSLALIKTGLAETILFGFATPFGGLDDLTDVDEMGRVMTEAFMPLTQAWREQIIARQYRDVYTPHTIKEPV